MSDIAEKREAFTEVKLAKAVRIPTVVLVIILAGSAFVISFDALKDLAQIAGIPHPALFPLIIDGLIVVATFAAVSLDKLLPKAKWYPWATLVVFAGLSIWGNALHAVQYADVEKISIATAAVVSAIPPISLLLGSHLLVLMIQSTTVAQARRKKAKQNQATEVKEMTPATNVAPIRKPQQNLAGIAELAEQVAVLEKSGKKVTGAEMAELLGSNVSERTGRRKLEQVRAFLDQEQIHREAGVS